MQEDAQIWNNINFGGQRRPYWSCCVRNPTEKHVFIKKVTKWANEKMEMKKMIKGHWLYCITMIKAASQIPHTNLFTTWYIINRGNFKHLLISSVLCNSTDTCKVAWLQYFPKVECKLLQNTLDGTTQHEEVIMAFWGASRKKIVNVYLWLDHLFAKHYDRIGNNLNLLLKKIRNKHFPVKYLKYTLLQKKKLNASNIKTDAISKLTAR